MSGTSADAIDAALVGFESDGTTHLVCTHTLELPADLKTRIIAAQTRVDTTIRDVCEQDVALSLLYAAAVLHPTPSSTDRKIIQAYIRSITLDPYCYHDIPEFTSLETRRSALLSF